jgi:uncharacterized repeat protein (TIGR03803 family)
MKTINHFPIYLTPSPRPLSSRRPGHFLVSLLALSASLLLADTGRAASISFTYYTNLFGSSVSNGVNPHSALVLGSDGLTLFGTASAGGTSGYGTIFKVKVDGSGFQNLHSFAGTPTDGALGVFGLAPLRVSGNLGGLTLGRDGYIYGTTFAGGSNNAGTIYKIGQDGNGYQIIHSCDFESPIAPIIHGQDGALYGTGLYGQLFRMNPDGAGYGLITNLNNLSSFSGLMQGADGLLYGTDENADGNYELFAVATNGSGFEVVHTFADSEGRLPFGTPYQAPNGMLLGTLYQGASGGGIYLVNTNGSNFQVVHDFADGSTLNDGVGPTSGLIPGGDGWLYGTTSGYNQSNNGIYRIKSDGSGYEQIFLFGSSPDDGHKAYSAVTAGSFQGSTGALFGTTVFGGANGNGTVYSVLVNPPVSISPGSISAGGQTTLFWPSWAFSYQLQSATNLASGNWSTVTNGTPLIGLQVPASNSAAFFRLVSP